VSQEGRRDGVGMRGGEEWNKLGSGAERMRAERIRSELLFKAFYIVIPRIHWCFLGISFLSFCYLVLTFCCTSFVI
jgi:hypothetical protein